MDWIISAAALSPGFSLHAIEEAISGWAHNLGSPTEAAFRLLLAAVLGGIVGLEREIRGRDAGFRTNLLVSLGSALVMVVSVSFAYVSWPNIGSGTLTIDPARVAYGVMGGVGFLGAGVILKHGGQVRGLTTAAGLWCVAAIGLACGLGLYTIAMLAALLVIVVLWSLDFVDRFLPKQRYREITVRRPWHPGVIGETVAMIRTYKTLSVVDSSFERTGDLTVVDIRLQVAFRSPERYWEFERKLAERDDCELVASNEG